MTKKLSDITHKNTFWYEVKPFVVIILGVILNFVPNLYVHVLSLFVIARGFKILGMRQIYQQCCDCAITKLLNSPKRR